jgi:hypothetical protein
MKGSPTTHHIASVVLNFNSIADVMVLLPQLLAQKNIKHEIFIVDNASSPENVQRLKSWLQDMCPDAVVGAPEWVASHIHGVNGANRRRRNQVYFVLNNENRGYSAGNNIGIRLAEVLGCDAVLIVNPDMRIENPHYIAELAEVLFSNEKNCIAASRILDLDGKEQNPLREPTFWEELFWPRFYFAKMFRKPVSYILLLQSERPVAVPKVSGCCVMLRMAFLKATDYLDENVFLYCEEPILSTRVQRQNGYILFAPELSAVHAHKKSEKDNASRRMLLFIRSRKYYLQNYSSYCLLRRSVLHLSYFILVLVHSTKKFLENRCFFKVKRSKNDFVK